jgi:hypothetical protein
MTKPKDATEDFDAFDCSTAFHDSDPVIHLAATIIYRMFKDVGQTWAGTQPTVDDIAKEIAKTANMMDQGKCLNRSFGRLMYYRDPLNGMVEVGVSIGHLEARKDYE